MVRRGQVEGVRLADVLDLAGPLLQARLHQAHPLGLAQYAYGDKPLEPFYEVIDPILAPPADHPGL